MQVRGPKSGFRKTIPLRQKLRKDLTSAEKIFWAKIANGQFYKLKFRKQHGIGNYIVDFYCPALKLIIEIDGDTHAFEGSIILDKERTKYLESLGYRIIRYNNRDVLNNIGGVFQDLSENESTMTPLTSPPHEGGKEGGLASRGGEKEKVSPHARGGGKYKTSPQPSPW